MNTSYTAAQLEQFRRDARRLSREEAISHSEALDRVALSKGFKNWSLMAKTGNSASPAQAPRTPASTPRPPRRPPEPRRRYHLHGDQYAEDPSRYYCAHCDVFFDADHFKTEHTESNYGRFLSAYSRWSRDNQRGEHDRYRPADAFNILQADAFAMRGAREASRSPFHRWIEKQKGRADLIGDLARDIVSDRKFPVAAKSRAAVQRHLEMRVAAPDALRALRMAWSEFSRQLA